MFGKFFSFFGPKPKKLSKLNAATSIINILDKMPAQNYEAIVQRKVALGVLTDDPYIKESAIISLGVELIATSETILKMTAFVNDFVKAFKDNTNFTLDEEAHKKMSHLSGVLETMASNMVMAFKEPIARMPQNQIAIVASYYQNDVNGRK